MTVDSDGTRLLVADMRNNRVLSWTQFPTGIGQEATGVIGQPNLSSNTANAGVIPFYQAWGALFDSAGAWVNGGYGGGVFPVAALAGNPPPTAHLVDSILPVVQPNLSYVAGAIARVTGGLATRDVWGEHILYSAADLARW